MNRETRDKFASGTQKDITSGNAVWETAPAIFEGLVESYGPFYIDLTADAQRALLPTWFGPGSWSRLLRKHAMATGIKGSSRVARFVLIVGWI